MLHKYTKTAREGTSKKALISGIWVIVILDVIFGMAFLTASISAYAEVLTTQPHLPSDENSLFLAGIIIIGTGVVGSIAVGILSQFKLLRIQLAGLLSIGLLLLIIFSTIIFGIATNDITHTTELTSDQFTLTTVNMLASNTMRIRNVSGRTQVLCVSWNEECVSPTSSIFEFVPSDLTPAGLTIQPGQLISLTFSNTGTFQLMSEASPYMTVTIVVTKGSH